MFLGEDLLAWLGKASGQNLGQDAAAWPNTFRKARFLSAVDHIQLDRLRLEVMQVFVLLNALLLAFPDVEDLCRFGLVGRIEKDQVAGR